jgi:hypothetical protein
MSVKISMAMSEESGPPDCGSIVAHCTLEFDDESSQPQDSEAFQQNVHAAITACCRAVHGELSRRRQARGVAARQSSRPLPCRPPLFPI